MPYMWGSDERGGLLRMEQLSNYAIPIIALIGTIFGGAGLEFVKRWLSKAKDKDDTATELRNELRTDLTSLKKELEQVEREVTEWKNRYYEVIEKRIQAEQQLWVLQRQLEDRKRAGSDE